MERLTEWFDDGILEGILVKEEYGEQVRKTLFEKYDDGYLGMCVLKAYEDTGLSVSDIQILRKRLSRENTPEITRSPRDNDIWIPVDERLPEDETMMLVTCQTKAGRRSVNRAWYGAGCWHGTGSMSGVTAWMPLPAPYRLERSSNEEE